MFRKSTRRRAVRHLKVGLALALVLNLNWVPFGCGAAVPLRSATAGQRVILGVAEFPALVNALAGTSFADADSLDIDLASGRFRLIAPDGHGLIEGSVSQTDGRVCVSSLTISGADTDLTMALDADRRVTTIDAGERGTWHAASIDKAASAVARRTSLIDANRDLLALARQMDTGKFNASADQSQLDPVLAGLLSILSAILTPIGGILQPLLAVFSIVTAIEAMQPVEPSVQMSMNGAYVIEYYLKPGSRRRAALWEFDTDRSVTMLGAADGSLSDIILQGGSATMHLVTDGAGGLRGMRLGDTLVVLEAGDDQIIAHYANRNSSAIESTSYLGFELVEILNQLESMPRGGAFSNSDCTPPEDLVQAVVEFPNHAGDAFSNIGDSLGLRADTSWCTKGSIYSAMAYALHRDGFIEIEAGGNALAGWGAVLGDAGVCNSLTGSAVTCSELLRDDEILGEEADHDAQLVEETRQLAERLLSIVDADTPAGIQQKLEMIAM